MKKLNFQLYLRFLLISVFAVSLSFCKNAKQENSKADSFYTIPFAEIIKNKQEVKLSEFASDVKVIQLENIPEAMLGDVEDIEFTKDFIFVKFWMHPVLQFSINGKFIRNIGEKGKGPGEYNTCMKMSVDEKNQRVYIQTRELSMMVFNFEGKHIKTYSFQALASFANFWIWARDSMLLRYMEPINGDEPFVFIEYNEQGDTLQAIKNHIFWEPAELNNIAPLGERNFYYQFNNEVCMKGCYNDTVYSYNEDNKIVPRFFIDLEEHKLPEDFVYERKWTKPLPADLCWTGVHETSEYVFIPYGYHFDENKPESEKEEKGYVLYNKNTKEGIAVEETKQGGFIDDITGGPDFRPIVTNDNTALMLVSAFDMKHYLNSEEFKNRAVKFPEKKAKLNELNKALTEEDNHFVVLAKLNNPPSEKVGLQEPL